MFTAPWHLRIIYLSNVFGGVGSAECQLAVYDRFGGNGLEGHRDEILFDCSLRKQGVRDSRDGILRVIIRRCHGAVRQVSGANTTEHAVDANAETDRFLCAPQDPVTGIQTLGAICNPYGLPMCNNTWGNRHAVVVKIPWDGGLDTTNR